MDELQKFKHDSLLQLRTNYSNLVNYINSLPLNQNFRQFCFQNLDQGVFWVEKGLELLQAENKPKENNPTCEIAKEEKNDTTEVAESEEGKVET